MKTIVLGDIIREIVEKTTINNQHPVLTSSQSGLVSQGEYFNKQIASQDNTGYKIIRKGQFTYRAMSDTGRFYINQSPYEIGIVSPAYPVFEIIEDGHVLPEYIATYFRSDPFQNAIALQSTGSTRVSLKLGKIKDISIDIPSVSEQKEILENINEVESLIGSRREQLEKLDELVKSRFIELFGTVKNNPHGYPVVRIGECAKLQGGFAFKSSDYIDDGIRLVQISNVNKDTLDWDSVNYVPQAFLQKYKDFELHIGDLVLAMTRPVIKSLDAVKIATVSEYDVPSLLNQRVGRFVIDRAKLNVVYLMSCCQMTEFREYVEAMSGNSLQPNISSKQVENYSIILPPMELQEQFDSFVKQTDKSKLAIQESLAELETLKKALMQKYFG